MTVLMNISAMVSEGLKTSISPSGGSDMGGLRQYMWYPLSQSSQNSSWSWKKKTPIRRVSSVQPQRLCGGHIWSTHVVLWGSAHVAALALYALPAVRLHRRHHDGRELQTGWVACAQTGRFSGATKICNLSFLTGRRGHAPERPQSEQDTSSSDWPVLWLVLESPKQKSQ